MKKDISKKKEELLEKEHSIYEKRGEAINEIPSSLTITASGMNLGQTTSPNQFIGIGGGQTTLQPNQLNQSLNLGQGSGVISTARICSSCGNIYYYDDNGILLDDGRCNNCKNTFTLGGL